MSEREQETPEPQPIAPAPADEAPSATGVIAGDEDEVKPADGGVSDLA